MSARIGPYELVRLLGRGGMGEVWLARATKIEGLAKWLAVKVIRLGPDARTDELLREARIALALAHSNIVSVFDVGIDGDRGYVAMEWIDGIDLAHLVEAARAQSSGGVGERVAVFVVTRLLRALAYAHTLEHQGAALGLVHRDISPSNLLVSRDGEVKLADFGIARSRLSTKTDGHVKGKLRYMAPEQFAGAAVDARADLFAVGAILHELLVGAPLRGGASAAELIPRIADTKLEPLPNVSAPVDALRRWLLQPDPSERVATASEALEYLRRHGVEVDATHELAQLCQAITGRTRPTDGAGVLGIAPARGRTENFDPDATLAGSRGGATTHTHAPKDETQVFSPAMWRFMLATLAAALVGMLALAVIGWLLPSAPTTASSKRSSPEAVVEPHVDREAPPKPTPPAPRKRAKWKSGIVEASAADISAIDLLCAVDPDGDGVNDLLGRVALRDTPFDIAFALFDGHDGSLRAAAYHPHLDIDYATFACVSGGLAVRQEKGPLELWSAGNLAAPRRELTAAHDKGIRSERDCIAVALEPTLFLRAGTFETIAGCSEPRLPSGIHARFDDGDERIEVLRDPRTSAAPYEVRVAHGTTEKWRQRLVSDMSPRLVVTESFVWVATHSPTVLIGFDRERGGHPRVWTPLDDRTIPFLILDREKLLVGGQRGACAVSAEDGSRRWCIGNAF
jgi:serine/threonine protein kinase